MRFLSLAIFLVYSTHTLSQNVTLMATHDSGARDTVTFGFNADASLEEDPWLGENNLFLTPVNGFEGRILQRDMDHYSCAILFDHTEVYYQNNFDSKINYRDPLDTTSQNRLFEVWYSDNQLDSIKIISDRVLREFFYALILVGDCHHDPPPPVGILVIEDDTIKQIEFKLPAGLGINHFIFFTAPQITTSIDKVTSDRETDISLYPNPTSGHFFIHHSGDIEIEDILIYNSIGQLIRHFDSFPGKSEIDMSAYSHGSYAVIFLLKNGKQIIRKLVKQ